MCRASRDQGTKWGALDEPEEAREGEHVEATDARRDLLALWT